MVWIYRRRPPKQHSCAPSVWLWALETPGDANGNHSGSEMSIAPRKTWRFSSSELMITAAASTSATLLEVLILGAAEKDMMNWWWENFPVVPRLFSILHPFHIYVISILLRGTYLVHFPTTCDKGSEYGLILILIKRFRWSGEKQGNSMQ